jgi:hypothetical protein
LSTSIRAERLAKDGSAFTAASKAARASLSRFSDSSVKPLPTSAGA